MPLSPGICTQSSTSGDSLGWWRCMYEFKEMNITTLSNIARMAGQANYYLKSDDFQYEQLIVSTSHHTHRRTVWFYSKSDEFLPSLSSSPFFTHFSPSSIPLPSISLSTDSLRDWTEVISEHSLIYVLPPFQTTTTTQREAGFDSRVILTQCLGELHSRFVL